MTLFARFVALLQNYPAGTVLQHGKIPLPKGAARTTIMVYVCELVKDGYLKRVGKNQVQIDPSLLKTKADAIPSRSHCAKSRGAKDEERGENAIVEELRRANRRLRERVIDLERKKQNPEEAEKLAREASNQLIDVSRRRIALEEEVREKDLKLRNLEEKLRAREGELREFRRSMVQGGKKEWQREMRRLQNQLLAQEKETGKLRELLGKKNTECLALATRIESLEARLGALTRREVVMPVEALQYRPFS